MGVIYLSLTLQPKTQEEKEQVSSATAKYSKGKNHKLAVKEAVSVALCCSYSQARGKKADYCTGKCEVHILMWFIKL